MPKAQREQGHARVFDLGQQSLRELNQALHNLAPGSNETAWEVLNPKGSHSVAVGVDQPVSIDVRGSVGYYCAGMNDGGTITVH
ncbi:MAG: protein GlxC, partial [Mesorhizobium sp.]